MTKARAMQPLASGLADPVFGSQIVFRTVLDALSAPGKIFDLSDNLAGTPAKLPPAAATLLLTLADYETPVWLQSEDQETRRWLSFHTGAPKASAPSEARFAVIDGAASSARLGDFNLGEDRYPDTSTTILVLCDALEGGLPVALTGPGIKGSTRFGSSVPLDTATMAIRRRISATYKDLPGGQVLGPTYDYTHRLFDFALMANGEDAPSAAIAPEALDATMQRVPDILGDEGLMEPEVPPADDPRPFDLTRDPIEFPADRDVRLQTLARGDEGFLLGLAYSVQRGFGGNHPFAGEIRLGEVAVQFVPEELGFAVDLGDITLTECQMVNQFQGSKDQPPQFTRGYGLSFGHAERKAMSMAIIDRSLKARDFGEAAEYPAQQEEFVLYHADNVEASGFVEHLKLPHYVDFQGELELLRKIRAEQEERAIALKEAAE